MHSPRPVAGPTAVDPLKVARSNPTSRTRSWRAAIAAAVTALMLIATIGVAAFAQTGRATSPDFLPPDTLLYAEARLDLPGDQRDQLLAFLSAFPGFADPGAFDTKLDDAIDGLLGDADAPISWTEDVKPWFGGQVMVGLPTLTLDPTTDDMPPPAAVIALGVTDRAALDAALAKLFAASDEPITSEDWAGTTISSMDGDDGVTALAPTDELLLFSNDVDQLKASLDLLAAGGPSLADDPDFQAAMATLPADRLGAFIADTAQLTTMIRPYLEQQEGMAEQAAQFLAALDMIPPTVAGHIRVDADHLTARIDAPIVEGAPLMAVRSTDLATKLPAGTLAYLETRDVGAGLRTLVAQLKPMMASSGGTDQLAQIEALLGAPLEEYLSWVEDLAVGVSVGSAGPSVGLVATVADEETAQERLGSLLAIVRIVASTMDPAPITMTTEDVDGVTVTSIALTDAAGMGAGPLPVEPRISIALADGHLYLGLGDFASEALTMDGAASLAATPSFARAVEAAGGDNAGLLYVDVASALGLVEAFMPSDDRERYAAEVKPYLEALDFIVASLDQDGTTSSASLQLFVK